MYTKLSYERDHDTPKGYIRNIYSIHVQLIKGELLKDQLYTMYSAIIWYRGFYDPVYSRAISNNFLRHFVYSTTVYLGFIFFSKSHVTKNNLLHKETQLMI